MIILNSEEKHSNGKVVNQREKDWRNKVLTRDKHVEEALCAAQKIIWHETAQTLVNKLFYPKSIFIRC